MHTLALLRINIIKHNLLPSKYHPGSRKKKTSQHLCPFVFWISECLITDSYIIPTWAVRIHILRSMSKYSFFLECSFLLNNANAFFDTRLIVKILINYKKEWQLQPERYDIQHPLKSCQGSPTDSTHLDALYFMPGPSLALPDLQFTFTCGSGVESFHDAAWTKATPASHSFADDLSKSANTPSTCVGCRGSFVRRHWSPKWHMNTKVLD